MKLNSIQFLRAVAALMIVVCHYPGAKLYVSAAGVDIFFVISGFIMGTVAMDTTPGHFLYNRLVRIVPLYWAMTLVMCVGAMFGVFATFSFTPDQLWKSLLFIPYLDGTGLIAPLLVVGWTLNLEMLFYVVFAIGLALRAPLLFTVTALGLLVAAGQVSDPTIPAMKLWTSVLLVEFAAGLVLSRLTFSSRRGGLAAIALALAGFALAEWINGESEQYRLLFWGLPAFLAVSGCIWLERAGGWPDTLLAPLAIVGDASYALYLIHGVVISFVHKLVAPGLTGGVLSVAVAVVASICLHKLVEKPLIAYLKKISKLLSTRRGVAENRLKPKMETI